jgi:hypothetical protein
VLTLRSSDSRDLRAQLDPDARRHLTQLDGVTLGATQVRLDLTLLGDSWRGALTEVLETAAGAVPV